MSVHAHTPDNPCLWHYGQRPITHEADRPHCHRCMRTIRLVHCYQCRQPFVNWHSRLVNDYEAPVGKVDHGQYTCLVCLPIEREGGANHAA